MICFRVSECNRISSSSSSVFPLVVPVFTSIFRFQSCKQFYNKWNWRLKLSWSGERFVCWNRCLQRMIRRFPSCAPGGNWYIYKQFTQSIGLACALVLCFYSVCVLEKNAVELLRVNSEKAAVAAAVQVHSNSNDLVRSQTDENIFLFC